MDGRTPAAGGMAQVAGVAREGASAPDVIVIEQENEVIDVTEK